jgi:predicted O-methyltransferase YrrM
MAIRLAAAAWLEQYALRPDVHSIVELGGGFSTLVFARALESRPDLILTSADHSSAWLDFVLGQVSAAARARITPMSIRDLELALPKRSPSDLIFVDHGPTYEARLASVPLLVAYARRSGAALVFDDWFGENHSKERLFSAPLRRALKSLGARCETIAGTMAPGGRSLGRFVESRSH